MVKVGNWNDPQLTEAILIWTGYGDSAAPRRDDTLVKQRFGAGAAKWLTLIDSIVDEFYQSNANFSAADLQDMWTMAIADFKTKYPDAPEELTKALAWCYTFDNR